MTAGRGSTRRLRRSGPPARQLRAHAIMVRMTMLSHEDKRPAPRDKAVPTCPSGLLACKSLRIVLRTDLDIATLVSTSTGVVSCLTETTVETALKLNSYYGV